MNMAMVGALAGVTSPGEERPQAIADPLPSVRFAVRALLLASPAYQQLDADSRRQMAQAMVKVCHTAANLIREELESDEAAHASDRQPPAHDRQATAQALETDARAPEPPPPRPLATAQSAGSAFSGVSASRVAGTTRDILNAVSFPRFVTELINGVFKAMIDSSTQQMHSFVELLNNVAASLDGFADSNLGPDRARAWLAERYPASFEVSGEPAEPGDEDEGGGMTLRLKSGASMPSPEALRTDLGLGPSDSVPAGDPERTLVPLARRQLAQQRQQMLATMVMLGMQRIVVESGRITAAMRFHIDTRSAAQADEGSTFDFRNQINASGSFGVGAWGASASMSNTIGYVSTQRTQTTEEMNTDLDLSSSVEINFKTDYLPLNRMASPGQADAVRANSRNPEAEFAAARDERKQRADRAATSDHERREALDRRLAPPPPAQAPAPGSPGTVEAADRARTDAARRSDNQGGGQGGGQSGSQGGTQSGNQGANRGTGQSGSSGAGGGGTAPAASGAGAGGGGGSSPAGSNPGRAGTQATA